MNRKKHFDDFMQKITNGYDKILLPLTQQVTTLEKWVRAADGTRLKTIIVKPKNIEGPYPVIVTRSCYYQSRYMLQGQAEELAKRGFVMVYQWCRGIGDSEGTWKPYIHEREDGVLLLQWLQAQEWVKNIGWVGASYLALAGWFVADIVPEKVKTMYLTVYGTRQHMAAWQEGAFRQDVYTAWTMKNTGFSVDADYMESVRFRPQIEVDEALWGDRVDFYRDEISRPDPSDPFWSESYWETLKQVPSKMKIPIFLGEGWYDLQLQSSLQAFCDLSEASAAHSVLQVNPGEHDLKPVIPGQKKKEYAAVDEPAQQIKWFYDILVKEQLPKRQFSYYLIGADEWRSYSSYPPNVMKERIFYLDGKRLLDKPGNTSAREYDYDPENPVMTHGAETLFKTRNETGSLEQPVPDWRADVLSYVSEELEADCDITGALKANLWVRSNAPDTCFTIKFIEVFPDGRAFHIRNGITTLAWRNSAEHKMAYDGKPVEVTITCWDVAWRLQRGSRVRVDISSSDFPEYSVHPNTEIVWSMEKKTRVAHQTVFSGVEYPSKVILPIG